MHKLLEKTQEHNLDIIQELNNENKKNKNYLETLILRVSEILTDKKMKGEETMEETMEEIVEEREKVEPKKKSKRGRKKKDLVS